MTIEIKNLPTMDPGLLTDRMNQTLAFIGLPLRFEIVVFASASFDVRSYEATGFSGTKFHIETMEYTESGYFVEKLRCITKQGQHVWGVPCAPDRDLAYYATGFKKIHNKGIRYLNDSDEYESSIKDQFPVFRNYKPKKRGLLELPINE